MTASARSASSAGRDSPSVRLRRLGGMAALALRTVAVVLGPTRAWIRELPRALGSALRTAAVTTALLVAAWAISTPGVQLGNFLAANGQVDRLGGYLLTTSLRWLGPAIAVLGLAVSAGGRLTAQLAEGREPWPRGSDPVRAVVAPSVVAFGLAAVMLCLLSVPVGTAAAAAVAATVFDVPLAVLGDSVFANATVTDLAGSAVKAGLSGLLVGLLCCYAGLEAREDEGRTVVGPARAVRLALLGSLLAVAFVSLTLGTYAVAAFPDLRFSR